MAKKNQIDELRASVNALKSDSKKSKSNNKQGKKQPKAAEIPAKSKNAKAAKQNKPQTNLNSKAGKKVKRAQPVKSGEIKLNQNKPQRKSKADVPAQAKRKKQGGQKKSPATPLRIAFLGGINEVGKNMTLYEYKDDIIIVDCGLAFPEPDMFGVDMVIPDFTYVEKNIDRVRGIIITHGHEDHIGGLAYLLKSCKIPVYATRLTVGLIQGKLREHNLLSSSELNEVRPGDTIRLGGFSVEMIHVNHSIPDAIGLAVTCGAGTVVQTGDFKIDSTPIDGGMIDIARFAQIGNNGVLALLSDSTNAERPGFTESERKVGESFEILFRRAGKNRIIAFSRL